jgi:hypothetical protein
MKRWMMFGLMAALAVTANANDFFGIEILGEPKDDVNAIIQNLIHGDYEKSALHLKHMATTAPKFAKSIKLSDFTIPCADCLAEKDPECQECNGKLKVVDPHSLRYLQYKFDNAIEEGEPVEVAWAGAKKEFDIRKKQVPKRAVFQGNIIGIGEDAFLIKDVEDKIFYLMGCVTDGVQVGQPYVGYYWPMPQHPHTYKDKAGKSKTVKSYTLNLWWDY